MSRRRSSPLTLVVLLVTSTGAPAEALPSDASEEGLNIRTRDCVHLSQQGLRDVLTMELRTLGVEGVDLSMNVEVVCEPGALLLSVRYGEDEPLTHRINHVPVEVPERSVALALSELVSQAGEQRRRNLVSTPKPEAFPTLLERPVSAAAQPETLDDHGRNHAAVHVALGIFDGPTRVGGGLRLDYFRAVFKSLELGASVGGDYGTLQDDLVSLTQLTVSAAPQARVRVFDGHVSLRLGLALPIGWVSWTPSSSVPGATESPLGAPWAAGRAEAIVGFRLTARFGVFAGGALSGIWLPARGTARVVDSAEVSVRPLIELSGAVFAGSAGVGVNF